MKRLISQGDFRKLAKTPSFILVGSIGVLIISQFISALLFTLISLDNLSDSIKSLISISVVGSSMAGLLWLVLKKYGGNLSTLALNKPSNHWIKLTAISIISYLIVSTLLIMIASYIFKSFNPNEVQDVGISGALSLADKFAGFIAIVLLTPIIEETLFRGLIFRGLRLSSPFWLAATVSSALFALAHGQWNVALDTFVLGLVLCNLADRTKSIIPGIFIHALKNSVAFVILFVV